MSYAAAAGLFFRLQPRPGFGLALKIDYSYKDTHRGGVQGDFQAKLCTALVFSSSRGPEDGLWQAVWRLRWPKKSSIGLRDCSHMTEWLAHAISFTALNDGGGGGCVPDCNLVKSCFLALRAARTAPTCFHFASYPSFIKVLFSGQRCHTLLWPNSCSCTTWKWD